MFFRLSSGLSLSYRSRGAGRPVVLLHPVGLRGAFWNEVVGELETEMRLIVPDARGHGDSDVPSMVFSIEDMADDVIELLRAVGSAHGGVGAVVVGCSMGGMVAQAVALRAPELLAGFVVANTGFTRNDAGRATMEARAVTAFAGMPRVLDTTLSRWFSDEVRLHRPDLVLRARDWLLDADPVVHGWSWRAIRDLAHADTLPKVGLPALMIAGSDDQSTAPATVRAMAAAVPGAIYRELADTGHLAPLERPGEFAALLRDFIAGLPPHGL
jgi:3-oxoadipate enol-lactonase